MKRYVNRITPGTRRERPVREKPLFNLWQAEFPEEAEDWYGDLAPDLGRRRPPPVGEWDDPTWVAVTFDEAEWVRRHQDDIEEIRRRCKSTGEKEGQTSVVYYARRFAKGPIKIGTSRWVNARSRNLGAYILATEPGGYELEAVRHFQFEPFRISRGHEREWFRPEQPLLDHIASLSVQAESA